VGNNEIHNSLITDKGKALSSMKEEVMRMGFGLLVGILIILFGLGITINVVFHINIPIFKILVGFFLICLGLKMILGNWLPSPVVHGHSRDAVFNNRVYHGLAGDSNEYNAVFGKALIDLRGIELKEIVTRIEINAVFGGAEVILDKDIPVRIKAEAVFGGVELPENVAGGFGSASYQSKDFDRTKNHLRIDASSVFGGIEIHY
jgi:predicted membrane protein